MIIFTPLFFVTFCSGFLFVNGCRGGTHWPVEKRARSAEIVFYGLAVENYPEIDVIHPPENGFYYTAQFWLINVFKGDQQLSTYLHVEDTLVNGIYDIHDRYIFLCYLFYKAA